MPHCRAMNGLDPYVASWFMVKPTSIGVGMKTVHEVSELAGVSVRTLHHSLPNWVMYTNEPRGMLSQAEEFLSAVRRTFSATVARPI